MAAGGGLRAADSVEWGTVTPSGAAPQDGLTPVALAELLDRSRKGPAHRYANAQDGFLDLAEEMTR